MNQKYFELQHKSDLLACGTGKIWRLEDIGLSISGWHKSPTKRTLERWVSRIPWLKSSHKIGDQVDELNRPANKLVLSSLVSGARKKRKTTLHVSFMLMQLLQFNRLRNHLLHIVRRRTCFNQTRSPFNLSFVLLCHSSAKLRLLLY